MRSLPGLVLVFLLCAAVPASASTVSVRHRHGTLGLDEVHYRAAPGEANRVFVSATADSEGATVTVTDSGASIAAGANCTSLGPHSARCTKRAASDNMSGLAIELRDRDDRLSVGNVSVRADGGPGNDRITAGPGGDRISGGGGRDALFGGAGPDVLTDGDRDGARGAAGPGPDVMDGGEGFYDLISYSQRRRAVRLDIGDGARDGAPGEGDDLRGAERLQGGAGDDWLGGDARANTLLGGRGDDRLYGRASDVPVSGAFPYDVLIGGRGRDRLYGGPGPDVLKGHSGGDRLSCGGG